MNSLPPWPKPDNFHTIVFDFDGVFTNNQVWVGEDGREYVSCSRGDGLGIDLLRCAQKNGLLRAHCFILSTEKNTVAIRRAEKLKLPIELGVRNKLTFLRDYFAQRLPMETTPLQGMVYLGNDLNDLAVMQQAGFAVAPADAHPRILQIAHAVLPQCGGAGFVRAFIERFLSIDHLTTEQLHELISDC